MAKCSRDSPHWLSAVTKAGVDNLGSDTHNWQQYHCQLTQQYHCWLTIIVLSFTTILLVVQNTCPTRKWNLTFVRSLQCTIISPYCRYSKVLVTSLATLHWRQAVKYGTQHVDREIILFGRGSMLFYYYYYHYYYNLN